MEWFGSQGNPLSVSGSLHSATDNVTNAHTLSSPVTNAHTYTLDWRPTSLEWGIDGITYATVLKQNLKSWAFDDFFFLILNFAIGGTMGGPVPALPQEMIVHSVSLYDAEVLD